MWLASAEQTERYLADKANGAPRYNGRREEGPWETRDLRAGTKAQTEMLESAEGMADEDLARAHWAAYRDDHGIYEQFMTAKDGFSRYVWAYHYLKRRGLLIDNGYEYGTDWL